MSSTLPDAAILAVVSDPLSHGQLRARFADLTETPAILKAFDFARDRMSPVLFNHVTRSWIFAAKIGARRNEPFDAEIVAVTTLLHDLGFTAHGKGPHRFEVNGANLARAFVRDLGFDDRRAQLGWDGIALHVTHSISLFKETEVALSSRGIGVDFGTADYATLDPAEIAAVIDAVPRLDFKTEFASCAIAMATTQPESTYDTFIRDFGDRYLPDYHAPSWVDAIAAGPFAE